MNEQRLMSLETKVDDLAAGQAELRTAVGGLRTDVADLRSLVGGQRTDLDGLRTDVGGLRTDVDRLRVDVGGLRTDVDGLRTDVGGLRTDVSDLKQHMLVLHEETLETIKALAPDLEPIRREFRAADETLREDINRRLDPLEHAVRELGRRRRSK